MDKVYEQLIENSISATPSAIEIYGNPGFKYRDEIFAILNINSRELLLKAKILREVADHVTALFMVSDGKPKLNRSVAKESQRRSPTSSKLFRRSNRL